MTNNRKNGIILQVSISAFICGGDSMDFEKMLDEYKNMTCIISVDRTEDGSYGNIRVAAGNKAHCDESERVMGHPFVPDRPYEESLVKDKNFEDFCYRSAILGQSMHTYVSLHQMGL
jgi:hypothetical protein